jgi:hypothetical protein
MASGPGVGVRVPAPRLGARTSLRPPNVVKVGLRAFAQSRLAARLCHMRSVVVNIDYELGSYELGSGLNTVCLDNICATSPLRQGHWVKGSRGAVACLTSGLGANMAGIR